MTQEDMMLAQLMQQGQALGELKGLVQQSLVNQDALNDRIAGLLEGQATQVAEVRETAERAHRRISKIMDRGKWVVGGVGTGLALAGKALTDKLHVLMEALHKLP